MNILFFLLFSMLLFFVLIANFALGLARPMDNCTVVDLTSDLPCQDIDDTDLSFMLGLTVNAQSVNSGVKMDPALKGKLYILNSEEELKDPSKGKLMKKKTSTLHFKQTGNSVYFNDTDNAWYRVRLTNRSHPIVVQPFAPSNLVPVTGCLDNENGSGGSVAISYAQAITINDYFSGTGTATFTTVPIAISGTLGLQVSPSYTFTGTYTCNVDQGEFGQLFIQPYYVEVPETSRVKVSYKKFKGLIQKHPEEKLDNFYMLVLKKPNHYCVTDKNVEKLKCASK